MRFLARFIFAVTACLLSMGLFLPQAYGQASGSEEEVVGKATPSLVLENVVTVSSQFGLYDRVRDRSEVTITAQFGEFNRTKTILVYLPRSPASLNVEPHNSNYSVSFYNKFYDLLEVSVPAEAETASIFFVMRLDGSSVLGRNSVTVPYVPVSINAPPYMLTSYIVSARSSPDIVYTDFGGLVPLKTEGPDGIAHTIVNPTHGIAILYEGSNRLLYGAGFIVAIFSVAVLARVFVSQLRRFVTILSRIGYLISSRIPSRRVSDKLLVLYITLSILMIGFSLGVGPDPTPRVYLSATPETVKVLAPYVTSAGFSYLTPATGGNQFDVMASLGSYRAAIVADYEPGYSGEQALPGLGSLQRIYIMGEYASSNFTATAKEIWGISVQVVESEDQLVRELGGLNRVDNALGLTIPPSFFQIVLVVMGISSFLLAFLAMAFLTSRLVESGGNSWNSVALAVAYSVMMFVFSQMVYMASAVLLQFPLGLHAGVSGLETAVGLLGFGGGTRPRMVACMLGFIFGAVVTREGRMNFYSRGFFALVAIVIFLIAAPLDLGVTFHQILLASTTSEIPAGAGGTINLVKGYIGSVGSIWTTEWSSSFFIQRGVPIFYAAVIAFSLYSRVGKMTATMLLLFTAFIAANGFVRIADQVPVKSIASIAPGLILGFAVIPIILLLDRVERLITSKLGRAV